MKYILGLILLSSIIISCKKDNDDPPESVISRDSILVSRVWQIKHIRVLQNNFIIRYDRGGQDNNWNYDNDYFKFEKNGTGSYTAGNDVYDISWQFDNSDKTELSYTIHDYSNGQPAEGFDLDVKLENVFISENSLRYAELYTNDNGTNTISSVYREPRN
jgi:hypothetical protein